MRVLAIDSAMNGCSACVYETRSDKDCAGTVLAEERLEISRGQAEHLMPMIQSVMEKAGVEYKDLDLIGVTNGPGAFTGMRIGIATAKAIGLAAGKPVVGVSTLLAVLDTYLSQNASQEEEGTYDHYALILETKRKDYYFQMFDCNKEAGVQAEIEALVTSIPAKVASGSEIETIIGKTNSLLIGDATDRLMREHSLTFPSYVVIMPEIKSVAKLAVLLDKDQGREKGCKPVYLRGAEIGVSKNIPRSIKQCRG